MHRGTIRRYIDTISGSSLRPAVSAVRSLTRRYSIQSSWLRSSALTLLHLFFLSFFLALFHFFFPRPPASATLHSFTLACSRSVLFFLLRSLVPSDRCYLLPLAHFCPPFSLRFIGVFYSFTRVHAFSLHFTLDFFFSLSFFLYFFFFFNSSRHDRSLRSTSGALAFLMAFCTILQMYL